MPTYINKETGLAESVATPSTQHEVPLMSPEGQLGSAPPDQAPQLVQQGYRQLNKKELRDVMRAAHFNEPMEQAKAFASAAGSSATFGLSKLVEQAAGRSPEDQRTAEETNPGLSTLGQVAGVAGSALTGVGEGAILSKMGGLAAAKVAGKSTLGKIAASATGAAVENALFQVGNEATKFIQEDPSQTAQTAIANVGLSAILGASIGGGLGAAKAGLDGLMESKASQFITDFKSRISERMQTEPTATPASTEVYDPFTKQMKTIKPSGALTPPTGMRKTYDPFTKQVVDKVVEAPEPLNETAGGKAADHLIQKGVSKTVGAAGGAITGAAFGHPILGSMIGERLVGSAFDNILPVIIKPILNNMPNGAGLRAAAEYITNAVKGENQLGNAVKAMFGAARETFSEPGIKDTTKLQAHLDKIGDNPQALMGVGTNVGHYMPDHATNLASTTANASMYLKSLRPQHPQGLPLDPTVPLNSVQKKKYEQALAIAESPLYLMGKVKKGSITNSEVHHLQQLYPALYTRMNNKIMEQLINHKASGGSIPYKTKVGMSVFMGQPLDSSMLSNSIAHNQSTFVRNAAVSPGATMKASSKPMKIPGLAQLPSQSRATFRSTGHR